MVKTRSTAEELWAPKFTPSFLKKRCDLMQRILKKHDPKGVYRKNTKKQSDVFNTKFSFLLGATTNALGAVAFTTPISGKPGRGMCVTPLYDQQKPKWQKALYALADEIISVADPEFAKGDYIVHFSGIDSSEHYAKTHVDGDDFTYQLAVQFGNFKGCTMRLYDDKGMAIGEFDHSYSVLKFDGRLPHEVVMNNFEGERFTVIFFKSGDRRMSGPAPIFTEPHILPWE